MAKKNIVYEERAKYIFSFYEGIAKPGNGQFLLRTLKSHIYNNKLSRDEFISYQIIVHNLKENGYFEIDDDDSPVFVRLTQKGYEHLQGLPLITNSISLRSYVNLTKDTNGIFNELWDIIGKEGIAPFYVSGPAFLDAIHSFVGVTPDYATYINELKENNQSTSRICWFKDLFKQLRQSDIPDFLQNLSLKISIIYEGAEELQEDIEESDESSFITSVKQSLESKDEIPRKKVFISYCWEDEKHKNWVHSLAKDLQDRDFEVIIDVKQPLGTELNVFMAQTIDEADKVLIIATPEYKKRADRIERGVGYETILLANDLMKDQNKIKVIPIIRKGEKETSYPMYLGNRKGLPMTESDDYSDALEELVTNLKNKVHDNFREA